MYEKGARDPISAGTCARCGGKVSGPVSSCPHCGAPARFIFSDPASAARPGRATPEPANDGSGFPHDQSLRPSHSFASNDSVYPDDDVRPPPPRRASRRGVKASAVLALVVAAALLGGAVFLHWYEDSDTSQPQTRSIATQGNVTSNVMSEPSQPVQPIQPGRPSAPTPATPQAPAVAQSPPATQPSARDAGDKNRKMMPIALSRAHDGLARNDLHMARSGVYWALSLQPDNPEALQMKQDLLSRERARDDALKAARSCVVQQSPICAWQNANHALSIDSSSTEAKALVAH